ncbi:MAG: hypothetical protein U1F43_27515 [Myxococcota bacterium]
MVSFANGYLVFGQRLPIRFHWSLPVGALVLGGFELRPWFWLAFVVLTLLHELGHAVMVWRYKKRVVALDVSGIGGTCHWRGAATPWEESAIAWGGVLAQAVVLLVTYIVGAVAGPPQHEWSWEIYGAFTKWNLMIIGINLLPIGPLDGVRAWRIIPLWSQRAQRQRNLSWEVKRRVVIHDAQKKRGADVFDLEKVRDARQRRAVEDVDAEVRRLVEKAHSSSKKKPLN